MAEILLVGAGGFLGAIARFLLGRWVKQLTVIPFPIGTLIINVLGCFAIGLVMKSTVRPDSQAVTFLVVGVLGAFTTFSTFSYETVLLFQTGGFVSAVTNILVTLLFCLGATVAGFSLNLF